ncbi:MAG TPA: hypothetical protein PLA69_02375 [Flavobacterium sp.]|nr:hypothetical protein [Flavobacterium sp.]
MKTLKYFALFLSVILMACSTDDDNVPANELKDLALVQVMSNETHEIELYTPSGQFVQGYNAVSLRIKDLATGGYVTNAQVSWMPMMQMMSMAHSCPFSTVARTQGTDTLYNGYIVFQMAENDMEHWSLTVDYTIDGTLYEATEALSVPASAKRTVNSFMGSDGTRYIVALIEPANPKIAINAMKAGIFKMENMMSFPVVDGYTLKIDPRMPGMGNHGSPNNLDLTQSANGFYDGKLSLTMSGYWKVNLQLANTSNEVVKGEAVTDAVTESSIYFEIEF